ncbi:hypothetical protein [Pseudonocardia lacus]|uniref:hypothetical protein n=1 Tax=Pseudonocardia lacus TaxID=2835865 RepID=UPI001BDC8066|nr:hypothetical protein [Pseudonocardia lacus]
MAEPGATRTTRTAPARVVDLLDATIERYGRDVVTDPLALAAALRAATDPPPDEVVAILVAVAGSGAVERLRAAVDRDVDPAAAAADAVADGAEDERWGVTLVGAALGLLPRLLVDDLGAPPDAAEGVGEAAPAAPAAEPAPTPTGPDRPAHRRLLVPVAAAVAVLLVGGIVGYAALAPAVPAAPGIAAPTTAPSVAAPSATPAPPTPATPTGAPVPADPRAAFTDPAVLALAEPYLVPGTTCTAEEPDVNVREVVNCFIGDRYGMVFTRYLSADFMRQIRAGFLGGSGLAPGATRSLRWKFVDGRPGVKTGIRAGSSEQGEGVRIRSVSEDGLPLLWFDQDSTGIAVMLSGGEAVDLDGLRAFWADPTG